MQLVVDKIARSFGINEIFKDISFMIDKGEKIGLVGVNGSGKTTLLRCLWLRKRLTAAWCVLNPA